MSAAIVPVVLKAPAKLNLCLFVGPTREDGLHELASIFEPLDLADELRVSEASTPGREAEDVRPSTPGREAEDVRLTQDEVVCPEVGGPNLVERALEGMREQGWDHPPARVEIEKRVPVAAGLGGGSADAAAVLRLARGEIDGLRSLAASVGADVPSQLNPRPCLVSGAGEVVEPIPPPADHGVVLVPQSMGLTTAEVYGEADRLGVTRGEAELEVIRRKLRDAVAEGASPLEYRENLVNDLEPAAISLRPEIEKALEALRVAGAEHAMVTGSGPTAFGLFATRGAAETAAASLTDRFPGVIATAPLDPATEIGPAGAGR